jgi:hypothetical protein
VTTALVACLESIAFQHIQTYIAPLTTEHMLVHSRQAPITRKSHSIRSDKAILGLPSAFLLRVSFVLVRPRHDLQQDAYDTSHLSIARYNPRQSSSTGRAKGRTILSSASQRKPIVLVPSFRSYSTSSMSQRVTRLLLFLQ